MGGLLLKFNARNSGSSTRGVRLQALYPNTLGSASVLPRSKQVAVQLFHWKFTDIELECGWLAKAGYAFVQTSPVQSHIGDSQDGTAGTYPWYIFYQPLGYNIGSKLGTEAEFSKMVSTCRALGVGVVVDVVLNHFAGTGMARSRTQIADFGTTADWNSSFNRESFPDPGFTQAHFHDAQCNTYCGAGCSIDWNNPTTVQYCQLLGLTDLKTEDPVVQAAIAGYLNKLVGLGVIGFRTDFAKGIPYGDWGAIFAQVADVVPVGGGTPVRPFFEPRVHVRHGVVRVPGVGCVRQRAEL